MDEPKLLDYCKTLYEAMAANAEPFGDGTLLWEGSLVQFCNEIGLGQSRYTEVTQALRAMQCIDQKRRGGGNTSSQWVLYDAPTIEAFEDRPKGHHAKPRKPTTTQQVRDLHTRVTRLEKQLKVLPDFDYDDSDFEEANDG